MKFLNLSMHIVVFFLLSVKTSFHDQLRKWHKKYESESGLVSTNENEKYFTNQPTKEIKKDSENKTEECFNDHLNYNFLDEIFIPNRSVKDLRVSIWESERRYMEKHPEVQNFFRFKNYFLERQSEIIKPMINHKHQEGKEQKETGKDKPSQADESLTVTYDSDLEKVD